MMIGAQSDNIGDFVSTTSRQANHMMAFHKSDAFPSLKRRSFAKLAFSICPLFHCGSNLVIADVVSRHQIAIFWIIVFGSPIVEIVNRGIAIRADINRRNFPERMLILGEILTKRSAEGSELIFVILALLRP